MSIKIMSWVLDHSPYTGKARLVHLVFADHANDEGICWPSQSTVAKRAGCSIEFVRTRTRVMEADGYIQIMKPSTGQGTSHVYRMTSPTQLGTLPKSGGVPPQLERPTSPNPSPSNHQEPSKEPKGHCPRCGDLQQWGGHSFQCPDYLGESNA